MFLLTIESVVLLKANKRGKVLCLLLIIILGGGWGRGLSVPLENCLSCWKNSSFSPGLLIKGAFH